jgi:hypothetical protein
MDWIEPLKNWAKTNDALLWWLGGVSLAVFLATPIAVGWTIVRLPRDYFAKEHRRPLDSWKERPVLRYALLAGKNVLGAVFVFAGLLMLIVPGQGLLTIVGGLVLMDFPGKFELERWLVQRPTVWRSINWLRRRAGSEPLKRPE